MHQIKVTNGSKVALRDRYDGNFYNFAPGESLNLPMEVAEHIFGVQFPMDEDACAGDELRSQIFFNLQKRWGWNSTEHKAHALAQAIFQKFKFTPIALKTVELAIKNEGLPLPRGDEKDLEEEVG